MLLYICVYMFILSSIWYIYLFVFDFNFAIGIHTQRPIHSPNPKPPPLKSFNSVTTFRNVLTCDTLASSAVDIEALKHAPNWGLRHRRDSISGLSTHSQPMGYAGAFAGTQSPAPTFHSGNVLRAGDRCAGRVSFEL